MADCNFCAGKATCKEHKDAEAVQESKRKGNRALHQFEDKIRRTGCLRFKKEKSAARDVLREKPVVPNVLSFDMQDLSTATLMNLNNNIRSERGNLENQTRLVFLSCRIEEEINRRQDKEATIVADQQLKTALTGLAKSVKDDLTVVGKAYNLMKEIVSLYAREVEFIRDVGMTPYHLDAELHEKLDILQALTDAHPNLFPKMMPED